MSEKAEAIKGQTVIDLKERLDFTLPGIEYAVGIRSSVYQMKIRNASDKILEDPLLAILIRFYLENPEYAIDLQAERANMSDIFIDMQSETEKSLRLMSLLVGRSNSFGQRMMNNEKPRYSDNPASRLALVLDKEIKKHGVQGAFDRLERMASYELESRGSEMKRLLTKGSWKTL